LKSSVIFSLFLLFSSSFALADTVYCTGYLKHKTTGKIASSPNSDPLEIEVDRKVEFGEPNTFGQNRFLLMLKTPVRDDEEQIHYVTVRRQVHYENKLIVEFYGNERPDIPNVSRLAVSSGTTTVTLGYWSADYSVLINCYEKVAWHKMNKQRCSEKGIAEYPAVKPFCDEIRKNSKKNFGED
jgi:hypothetical protein